MLKTLATLASCSLIATLAATGTAPATAATGCEKATKIVSTQISGGPSSSASRATRGW